MTDLGFVSIPALKQYVEMARSCGLDIEQLMQNADIDPALLDDNCSRITGEQLQEFLALVIPLTEDECFGLHTSAHIQPSSYSVLGYIAMNCATLGDALARVPAFEKIVGDMGVTTSFCEGTHTFVRWHCNYQHPLVRRHLIENVFGSWTRYTRWMTGEEHKDPAEVWFEHQPPSDRSLIKSEYEALFRCPIQFDKPISAIVIPNEHLEHKLKQADTQLLLTLEDHATQILTEIDKGQSLKHKVKNMLRLMIKDEFPRKEIIAEKLGVNSRTLQRRLSEEGSGYQEILNELRYEMAQNYLRNSRLSIDEIGCRLGFAEPRSFHRCFKQWSGVTPGKYRETQGK